MTKDRIKNQESRIKNNKKDLRDRIQDLGLKYDTSKIKKKRQTFFNASVGKQDKYNPEVIEKKWQKVWEENNIYKADIENAKKPFYNLMMFPYPSAEGLHVGNMYAFTGTDIYGRFQRMQGNNVLEPIGLDGFGIHSENYAIKVGRTPKEHASISEKNFYRQLHMIGNGFDWSRKLETYDPKYYKWTQWLFIQLFKAGLAYRKKAPVNFCPKDLTVLADEQVIDGKCERCGTVVEKRDLEQWFFAITKYADRLLNNIPGLDWSEKVKIAQKNWIGKKEGIVLKYQILPKSNTANDTNNFIQVFTTRPDTNFGATFIALAPENPIIDKILGQVQDDKIKKQVQDYVTKAKQKSEIDRQAEGREKTGVFTGAYALNPLTGFKMPIWVSDFVLVGFGTGALVGVPGHDKRDFEFASKFNLEIKRVVVGYDGDKSPITKIEQVQEEEGNMVNSEFLNGMDINDATQKIMDYMEEKGMGKRVATYHLRDWLISRQRYWGPPIPMIHCYECAKKGVSVIASEQSSRGNLEKEKIASSQASRNDKVSMAGWFPVEDSELPVLLPDLEDWKPTGTGESPLSKLTDWVNVKCPNCHGPAKRETDVSDTFLDSSWYFLRYTSTDIDNKAFDIERVKKWLPVTSYIGGAEHSVLHLLYSRFITMVLKDKGYISFEEPFAKFRAHGLLIKEGAKMSKSKGNVVIPDEYIKKFGADTLRSYLMFLGPYSQGGDFYDSGIEGMHRFLKRIWHLFNLSVILNSFQDPQTNKKMLNQVQQDKNRIRFMHKTIKKVTEEIANLRYNTAIAALMEWYNYMNEELRIKNQELSAEEIITFLKLLAPFAPHMTEELYQMIKDIPEGIPGQARNDKWESIHKSSWPKFDPSLIEEQTVTVVAQINGKVRESLQVSPNASQRQVEEKALQSDKVQKYVEGQKIIKVIYVPGRIINFVIPVKN